MVKLNMNSGPSESLNLVAEDSVIELLAVDLNQLQRQTAPAVRDADRNLYRPSQIADWINDHCMQRRSSRR